MLRSTPLEWGRNGTRLPGNNLGTYFIMTCQLVEWTDISIFGSIVAVTTQIFLDGIETCWYVFLGQLSVRYIAHHPTAICNKLVPYLVPGFRIKTCSNTPSLCKLFLFFKTQQMIKRANIFRYFLEPQVGFLMFFFLGYVHQLGPKGGRNAGRSTIIFRES